jgi:hypothetical protein
MTDPWGHRCDSTAYGPRAHDLGAAWYTLVTPDRHLLRFCDLDCLSQHIDRWAAAVTADAPDEEASP